MARIKLDGIRHAYTPNPATAADWALKELNMEWRDGGAYALLGPSGCGKTTLLNIASGLIRPTHGRIRFDERDVTELGAEARNIAQVFQFPVVYDTMTVRDNLAFPLRNRGVAEAEIAKRVEETLAMLDLNGLADRKARRLTADQKQKISLGRGMVRADVAAILFDEPLTVIDPLMKWELRSQLKLLHRQFGHTMIYVTHDQTEALTFADTVVVMFEGEVVQTGTPEELFERPKHTFVGYFIGSPGMNVLPVALEGGAVRLGKHKLALGTAKAVKSGGKLEIGVRPEHVHFDPKGLPIRITSVEDIGRRKIVRGQLDGHDIVLIAREDEAIPADARISFQEGRVGFYADSWRVEAKG
jgi:glycerol transport system ATP-binding protein